MKILIKIVTRITEHFSQHCNVDSPFQGFTKIVTTICKPNTSLPKMLTKVVAKIHEWKILTQIVARIPALKIFTEVLTKKAWGDAVQGLGKAKVTLDTKEGTGRCSPSYSLAGCTLQSATCKYDGRKRHIN